jgi:NAD(P)-dependent dehydrogenase (short-subunit alcohol dehydrogenase family)
MFVEKVAVITAGGSGMGADAARRLASDGFKVAILSSSGKGEALAKELGGLGVTGSNTSTDDLQRLVDQTVERWGRIDALVNSAGHGPRAPILELSDEDWHTGLDVYLMNVIRPTRLVTPIMQRQKEGTIINISTYAAFEPDPLFPTSGVFRAGLAAFTKLFADKYAADNVRMNNVLPGFIDSLPETEERRQRIPDAALRQKRRNRRDDCLPCFFRSGLYHRTKYPRRWGHHPLGLMSLSLRNALHCKMWSSSSFGH